MQNNLKNIIFVMVMAFLSWGAHAQGFGFDFDFDFNDRDRRGDRQELDLRMHDQVFRGQQVIRLKQLIRNQYPHLSPRDMVLKRAVLVAKSRGGRGQASLEVGHDRSFEERVPGHPEDFHDRHPSTYHRVRMENPSFNRDARGAWQIHLRGNIKVKRIRLVVRVRGGGLPPRVHFQHIDSMKVEKFISKTKRFSVHKRVAVIKLRAERNDVEIEEVQVRFANGEIQHIYELEGRIGEDRAREFRLPSRRGRHIESVRITATAGDLFGSRGRVNLDVGVLR